MYRPKMVKAPSYHYYIQYIYINFLHLKTEIFKEKNQSVIVFLNTLQIPHILTRVVYTSHEDRLKTKFTKHLPL